MSQRHDAASIAHVLNRVAYGPRPEDWQQVEQMGLEGYVRWQLEPERIADAAVEQRLEQLSTLSMGIGDLLREYPPPQLAQRLMRQDEELDEEARRMLAAQSRVPLQELTGARMVRAVHGTRQLTEVLVDFWFNHFNVFANKGQTRLLLTGYERDAIRPHVLGRFRSMLGAVARSPAMLVYLDNWQSAAEEDRTVAGPAPRARNDAVEDAIRRLQQAGRRVDPRRMQAMQRQMQQRMGRERPPGLNENYARELLELHTLGVDGGYTQTDVREVARALTGWTMSLGARDRAAEPGFVFRPDWHDAEEKTVLGTGLPAGRGLEDGEDVLDMLARHPSTASFIATKLCRKFIADEPPAALVNDVAGVFLRTDGDLRATTSAVLLSDAFLGTDHHGAKVKSPLEFLVSAARALRLPPGAEGGLARALARLGAPLYQAAPPTGYPDTAPEWTSANALLARMDVGSLLATGVFGGRGLPTGATRRERGAASTRSRVERDHEPGDSQRRGASNGPSGSVEQRADVLVGLLLPGGVSADTRQRIVDWGNEQDEVPDNVQIATLILGSPEFQRR